MKRSKRRREPIGLDKQENDESNIFTAVWDFFFQSAINVHKFHQRKF